MGDMEWVANTPAKKMGYREGDLFTVTGAASLYNKDWMLDWMPVEGDLVRLEEDDASDCPFFKVLVSSNEKAQGRILALSMEDVRKLEGQDDGE